MAAACRLLLPLALMISAFGRSYLADQPSENFYERSFRLGIIKPKNFPDALKIIEDYRILVEDLLAERHILEVSLDADDDEDQRYCDFESGTTTCAGQTISQETSEQDLDLVAKSSVEDVEESLEELLAEGGLPADAPKEMKAIYDELLEQIEEHKAVMKRDWTDNEFQGGFEANQKALAEYEQELSQILTAGFFEIAGTVDDAPSLQDPTASSSPSSLSISPSSSSSSSSSTTSDDRNQDLSVSLLQAKELLAQAVSSNDELVQQKAGAVNRVLSRPKNLGHALDLVGAYLKNYMLDRADAIMSTILPICRKKKGKLWLVKALNFYAAIRAKQSRYSESLEFLTELMEILNLEESEPGAWQVYDMVYRNFGVTYEGLGRTEEALIYFEKAMNVKVDAGIAATWFDMWDIGRMKSIFAFHSRNESELWAAIDTVKNALDLHERDEGSDKVMCAKILHTVGECYVALAMQREAASVDQGEEEEGQLADSPSDDEQGRRMPRKKKKKKKRKRKKERVGKGRRRKKEGKTTANSKTDDDEEEDGNNDDDHDDGRYQLPPEKLFRKALEYLQKSHALFKKHKGPYNPLTGKQAESVAQLLLRLKDYSKAKPFLLDALISAGTRQSAWGGGGESGEDEDSSEALRSVQMIVDNILNAHRETEDRDGLSRYFDGLHALVQNAKARGLGTVDPTGYEGLVFKSAMAIIASGTPGSPRQALQLVDNARTGAIGEFQGQMLATLIDSLAALPASQHP